MTWSRLQCHTDVGSARTSPIGAASGSGRDCFSADTGQCISRGRSSPRRSALMHVKPSRIQIPRPPVPAPGRSVNHVSGTRCKPCDRNTPVGNGGQGRNRTIDTRIFSTTERPVRREQAEDPGRFFAAPTEPHCATEPIPNRNQKFRTRTVSGSCGSTACTHRDRTLSEPAAERGRAGFRGHPPLPRCLEICPLRADVVRARSTLTGKTGYWKADVRSIGKQS